MHFLLVFLLFTFSLFSNLNINFDGEYALLEFSQLTALALCFFIHLSCRKLFLKLSNPITFFIRALLFLFLFYEEFSFVTQDSIPLLNLVNDNSEINLHNLSFAHSKLFEVPLPFIDYSFPITLYVLLISVFLLFLGFGLFLPYFNKFRYFFLEKQYSIYASIFILNSISNAFMRIFIDFSFSTFLTTEFLELFIYITLLVDVLKKKKIMRQKLTNLWLKKYLQYIYY